MVAGSPTPTPDPDLVSLVSAVRSSLDDTNRGNVLEHWWTIPVGIAAALAIIWLALAVTLWIAKPDDIGLQDMLRLLPDVLRLLKRLATDPRLPRRIRIVLIVLLGAAYFYFSRKKTKGL